jgi:hypothetical protein
MTSGPSRVLFKIISTLKSPIKMQAHSYSHAQLKFCVMLLKSLSLQIKLNKLLQKS